MTLKPCPFCGGDAELLEEYRKDSECHCLLHSVYFVRCMKCGVRTEDLTNDGYYGEHHTIEETAEIWNRRIEKRGFWEWRDYGSGGVRCVCSECGAMEKRERRFCHDCGALMITERKKP